MTAKERKATSVMWIDLAEASAKVRADVNHDDEGDETWPAWGGVVSRCAWSAGAPEPDAFVRGRDGPAGGPAALALGRRGLGRAGCERRLLGDSGRVSRGRDPPGSHLGDPSGSSPPILRDWPTPRQRLTRCRR